MPEIKIRISEGLITLLNGDRVVLEIPRAAYRERWWLDHILLKAAEFELRNAIMEDETFYREEEVTK